MIPGEFLIGSGDVELNAGRESRRFLVSNTGDRPIQVGSHTHFFEVNPALQFPREQSLAFRLNIPAGTALRFEPGDSREVEVVRIAGRGYVYGMSGLVNGPTGIAS